MSITADNYVDWAERDDRTPRDKTYPYNREKRYVVNHSIEGWLAPGQTVPPRFLSTERDPDGSYTAAAQASVTFVLLKDGRLIQCFPLDASPWTSGSRHANMDGVPIETEGVAGVPLNDAQVATYVRLVRELEPWFGFRLSRETSTLAEHRDLAQTACPSGRYQPAYDALAGQGDDMTPEDKAKLDAVYAAICGGVDKALTDWNAGGNALIQGLQATNARVTELEKPHIHRAPPEAEVPPHVHNLEGVTGGVNR